MQTNTARCAGKNRTRNGVVIHNQDANIIQAARLAEQGLLVPAIRNSASLAAACVGGVVAVLAIGLPYNLGLLLASFCGICTGLFVEHHRTAAGKSMTKEEK